MVDLSHLQDLIDTAVEQEDQTQVREGGDFEYTPPPAGPTVGRLIEYIELGKQPQRAFKGKAKPDADEVRVTFELLSPAKNIRTITLEGGEEIQVADKISINISKKLNSKAGFNKLFKAMTYGREDIKHMAQMLGEAFLITIHHKKVPGKDGAPEKVYANIRAEDGSYSIGAPVISDPISGTVTDIPVPEALSDIRLFLFNNPTEETWDSLFIDGTTTKKIDGVETEVSKNWLQAKILGASNIIGSALEQMLGGIDGLPEFAAPEHEEEADDEADDEAEVEEEAAEEEAPAPAPAPKAKAAPAKKPAASAVQAKAASPSASTAKATATPATKSPSKAAPAKAAPAKAVTPAPAAKGTAKAKPAAKSGADALAALGL